MNPAAPTISAKPAQNTPETLVFLERPEINPLDYADFSIMDSSTICSHIGLTHSNTVVLFVAKAQTYKSASLRNFAITVANYFNPSLGYAFPSQERLCYELNTTRQTISKWTKELVESGYWHVERGSEGKANRFTLPFVEFAHIRAFMASERRGENYIKGKGLFRTVIAESKQGAAGVSRPYAAGRTKTSTADETLRDPYVTVPVPYWGEPAADELAHASAPETPVTNEPDLPEPNTTVVTDMPAETNIASETSPVDADAESKPKEPTLPSRRWAGRSVTDEQAAVIVDSTVDAGLCLDNSDARDSVQNAIYKESDRDPALSPAQLEEIARKNLTAAILSGKWTHHDPARFAETLPAPEAPKENPDPFGFPDDLN